MYWTVVEDLYCMIGKQALPKEYPVLTRTIGAWKGRNTVIKKTVLPAHLE